MKTGFEGIRNKLLVVVAIGLAIVLLIQFAVNKKFIQAGYSNLEQEKITIQSETVVNVIKNNLKILDGISTDWAHWDDTYNFVEKYKNNKNIAEIKQDSYITSNYTQDTFNHLNINAIFILDVNGSVIYESIKDGWKMPEQLAAEIKNNPPWINQKDKKTGIMHFNNETVEIVSTPILPSISNDKPNGVFIMLREIDITTINDIKNLSHLKNISIKGDDYKQSATPNKTQVSILGRDLIQGETTIEALDGHYDIHIIIQSDREIYQQGEMSNLFIYAFSIMFTIFLAIFAWIFDKFVLERLNNLSEQVNNIGYDSADNIKGFNGIDEISFLADRINKMLENIRDSKKKLIVAEKNEKIDALTELPNKKSFSEQLDLITKDISKTTNIIATISLDKFKTINDSCGYEEGDKLLKLIVRKISNIIPDSAWFGRTGGDEFTLLFKQSNKNDCDKIINAIFNSTYIKHEHNNKKYIITASLSYTEFSSKDESNKILSAIQNNLDRIKANGGNNISFITLDDEGIKKHQDELDTIAIINEALDSNYIKPYIQRILCTKPNMLPHAEILARLHMPDGKIIPPGLWLGVAEKYRMMPQVDRNIINNTFKIISQSNDNTVVAINLSGQTITDKDFFNFIIEKSTEYRIDLSKICFEITETALVSDFEIANNLITNLKEHGVSFSLDDFGAGMSSFGYLKTLNVDYLKIDGMFVKNILTNKIDESMVISINNIGHTMGIHTIAEFAENDEIIQRLTELGVDYIQGYGIAKPVPFI